MTSVFVMFVCLSREHYSTCASFSTVYDGPVEACIEEGDVLADSYELDNPDWHVDAWACYGETGEATENVL